MSDLALLGSLLETAAPRPLPKKKVVVKSTAKQREIKQLEALIKEANTDYHSGSKKKTKFTDKQYDAAKDRLAEIDPRNKLLKKVGAAPTTRGEKKVTLPVFMGSLDKIYIDETKKLQAWLDKNLKSSTVLTASAKLDGISAQYGNRGGVYFLYTRGNGSQGTDISILIPHLKFLPKLKDGQIVRGEIVIPKSIFTKYFSKAKLGEKEGFDNARNLAAGIANKTATGVHTAAKYGEFLIHEMVKPEMALARVAKQLERMGGKIAPHAVIRTKPTIAKLAALLTKMVKESKYDLDGIVLDNGNGQKIAIKQENDTAAATVKQVRWQLSQHGYLTPVVDFETPIRLAGVMVSRATAHNAKRIVDDKIGPGAVITIIRSGEVIPKLLDVIKPAKASLPPKGTYEWAPPNKQGVRTHILSTSEDDKETVKIKKLTNFLVKLGVKGFKDKQLTALFDGGINTPAKLMKAPVSRFVSAGMTDTMAGKLHKLLHETLAKTPVPKLMVASNSFPRGFGFTAAKLIWATLADKSLTMSASAVTAKLAQIDGLGETIIDSFLEGRQAFAKFLADTGWTAPKPKKTGAKLKGMVFLFTGFRDAKLAEFLEHNGAEAASSFSKKVTHLIVRDKSYSNDKTTKAKEMGIKVVPADQARKMTA
ncbi:NAD-dependent DNA ligase protein [Rhizobium phage RHph_N28_1]|nr:NAD-dependent DNA ligase protein [Rhizobium phage RHph_N28_1]QIG74293.1 NAD-dependent DNA ligase protein [Rhizobium phage RHph_N42]QIG74902.1 NAD-dependent DNA ligase protein [Rhizobium phage RHph_I42]QXV73952.1 NAD-dependent DNA ligase protein [Rhizobium phage RHph_N46]